VAITNNSLDDVKEEHFPQAGEFEWWFQEFQRKSRKSGRPTIRSLNDIELSKIRQAMVKLPKGTSGSHYISLGKESAKAAKVKVNFANTRVRHQNIKNWLLNQGRQLLNGLDAETISELVTNAPEF
jgi:hypothetical protein